MPKGIPIGFEIAEKNPKLEPNLTSLGETKCNNSVILKDKNSKKLHNLHMAKTNLNRELWIRIYNHFAIGLMPDFRQTGIAKNIFPVNFSLCPVNFFAKRVRFLPSLFFL